MWLDEGNDDWCNEPVEDEATDDETEDVDDEDGKLDTDDVTGTILEWLAGRYGDPDLQQSGSPQSADVPTS